MMAAVKALPACLKGENRNVDAQSLGSIFAALQGVKIPAVKSIVKKSCQDHNRHDHYFRQPVRPKSPKVQKTTAATFTSAAKYCINVVAPANMLLKATPAKIMDSGETLEIGETQDNQSGQHGTNKSTGTE